MDTRLFVFRLKHLKGIGNKGLLRLLNHYLENPEEEESLHGYLTYGGVQSRYKEQFVHSYYEAKQITYDEFLVFSQTYQMVTLLEEEYPRCLAEIYNPPICLFYVGRIELLQQPIIGMVGARDASPQGKKILEEMIPAIVKKEIVVASGLARGNDTWAHQLTIKNKGNTIGVIGTGLDINYPKENRRLQEYMMKHHLVISEYLLGTGPRSYHFPSRNRIIAGISKGVCVIEAKERSGSLITAQLALEEGRDVFAVPGHPFDTNSQGCLNLIQEGAKCTWKPSDILEEWD